MPERIGLIAELDLSQFDRAVNSYLRSVNRLESATRGVVGGMVTDYANLGGVIASTMATITTAVAATAYVAGKELADWTLDGIKANTEFEQGVADIASVLRKTREEVQPLVDAIDTMALDPLLVVSAEEASDVVEQLARNGIEMRDILDGAAESTILLANATGGDFALSANVATMAMHMFNMQASELNKVADISQGVINNSRIELDDWALALGNGGAAAASYNIPLEDFATIIAGTINNFHSARQAGTSYMNFVQRLVPITKTAGAEMQKLGLFTGNTDEEWAALAEELAKTEDRIANLDPRLVHYDELMQAHTQHAEELRQQMSKGNNAFFDANGNMLEMAQVVQILTNATKDLSEEERTESFRRIFGNDALETALRLSKMTTAEFQALKNEIVISGSAADAAATRTQTLAKKWENLSDIWLTIQRKSGAAFNGMLLTLVKRLTELTNKNQDRVIAFFGRLATLTDQVVQKMMPWVERTLPRLIDNVESLASWLVEWLMTGNRLNEWFGKMDSPLRNFIDRIFQVVQAGKDMWNWLVESARTIQSLLRPFTDWVTENVTLRDTFIALAGAVATFLAPFAIFTTKIIFIAFTAAKAVSSMRRAWEQDFGHIRTIFETVWPKIQAPLTAFVNNFLEGRWVTAWDNMVEVVVTTLGEINRYLPRFFQPFLRLVSDVLQGKWGDAWRDITEIAKNTFEAIKYGLAQLQHPLTDFVLRILEGRWLDAWRIAQRAGVNAFNFLEGQLPVFFKPFANLIQDVLVGDWSGAWDNVILIAKNSFKALKDGLEYLDTPFTDFLLHVLRGEWVDAWGDITFAANQAYEWIIDRLYRMEKPFTDFLANVLSGLWEKAWEQIKNFSVGAYNWIVDSLYSLEMPFTDFLANVLTGLWSRAWDQIKNFATGAYNFIVESLYGLDMPFTDFLGNVLTGKWQRAWEQISTFATNAYNWIVEQLYALDMPFTNFLANVLTGKWQVAWGQIQTVATNALELIKQFLPTWGDDLVSALQDIINGRWADAWTHAKVGAQGGLELIKAYLPTWGDEFISALQSLLDGDWTATWLHARNGAVEGLEAVKQYLPGWGVNLVSALQAILLGDWGAAWTEAKDALFAEDGIFPSIGRGIMGLDTPITDFIGLILQGKWAEAWRGAATDAAVAYTGIKQWLLDLDGNFGDFIVSVLEGRWKTAWEIAAQGARAVKNDIVSWLTELNTPFSLFAANVLEGNWLTAWRVAQAGIISVFGTIKEHFNNEHVNVIVDFLTSIVLGKWGEAWMLAEGAFTSAFTLIRSAWDGFYSDILTGVNDTRIPAWIRSVFLAFYAVHEALLAAGRALFGLNTDMSLMSQSTDTWQDNIIELATSIRQLANMAEVAFLALHNMIITLNMANGIGIADPKVWRTMVDNSERIKEIWDGMRAEGLNQTGENITLNNDPNITSNLDIHDVWVTDVYKKLAEVKGKIQVEYLDLQELAALTGSNSVETFAQAFMAPNSADALKNIQGFASEVSVLAGAIKEGYLDAGDDAVAHFVLALGENYGIAREGSFALANNIIAAFGSRMTDLGGLTVPDYYKKSFIDPITGLETPITNESYGLGQLMTQMFGQGVTETQDNATAPMSEAAQKGMSYWESIVPDAYAAGADAVSNLGGGVTDNQAAGVDPYANIKNQIAQLTGELVDYQTKAGADATIGMGENVTANQAAVIDPYNAIGGDVNQVLTDIVSNSTQSGTDAITLMGAEIQRLAPDVLDLVSQFSQAFRDRLLFLSEEAGRYGRETINNFAMPLEAPAQARLRQVVENFMMVAFRPFQYMLGEWADATANQTMVRLERGFVDQTDDLVVVADQVGGAFRDKINSILIIIIKNFGNLAANIRGQMEADGTLLQMEALGSNMGAALKTGLDTQLEAVQASGIALAEAAAGGVVESAEIASPSKRFTELGDYIGQGLTLGLEKGLLKAQDITMAMVAKLSYIIQSMMGGGVSQLSNTVSAMQGIMSNFTDSMKTQMAAQAFSVGSANVKMQSNYTTTNAPISFGPIYISNEVDAAQFEYRVKQIMQSARQ